MDDIFKPCPFCGGKYQSLVLFQRGWTVECNCGAHCDFWETTEQAIYAWNKRLRETKLNEELGRQDAQIDFLKNDILGYKETIDTLIEVGDVLREIADRNCETEASAIFQDIALKWKEDK